MVKKRGKIGKPRKSSARSKRKSKKLLRKKISGKMKMGKKKIPKKRQKGKKAALKKAVRKKIQKAMPRPIKKIKKFTKREERKIAGLMESMKKGKPARRSIFCNLFFVLFFLIAAAVLALSYVNKDWYSVAIASFVMLLSAIFFRRRKRKKKIKLVEELAEKFAEKKAELIEQKGKSLKARAKSMYGMYFVFWLIGLVMAVFSILTKKLIPAVFALFLMLLCCFLTAAVRKRLKDKEMIAAIKRMQKAKTKRYETNFDKLLVLLRQYKKLKVSQVARGFGVSSKKAEEWGQILEEHNLLEINYPAFGEIELIAKGSKERAKREKQKKKGKKEKKGRKNKEE